MEVLFFILGAVLGSFYNVVGYRIPKGESIIYPPSHCPKCNYLLKPWELTPIFSFFLQRGKCTNCKQKISWYYPVFEALCGVLFLLAYLKFGLTYNLIIALTFISLLIILSVSDYHYMIFPDEVIVFFLLLLMIEIFFISGFKVLLNGLLNGLISLVFMLILKLLGDFLFKKESMGGGDIKLLFIFGLVLGISNSILSVIVGSFVGLPLSLVILSNKRNHEIPFGPLLAIGALIVYLTGLNFNYIFSLLQ